MSSRLTLALPPGFADTEVEVDTRRFSIGRTPENDLVIEDPSLSRRHALIENFDGRYNLTDCGSSNGTLVNGRQVTGMVELSDWDVLVFGGVGDIVVRIKDEGQQSRNTGGPVGNVTMEKSPAAVFAENVARPAKPQVATDQFWFSGPMIAAAAAVLILLVTGLVLLATRSPKPPAVPKPVIVRKPEPVNDNVNDDNRASLPSESTPSPVASESVVASPGDLAELSVIEAYASKVLTGISKDTHPVLTEKPLREISAQVQGYKGSSSLRDELRAMKRALPQISTAAKSCGFKIPLTVYATLARMDKGGGGGDPVQVSGQICAALARLRTNFSDELANDSLLAVAGLEEGPGLQLKLQQLSKRVSDSPNTVRSIWYLRDHSQIISPATYDFVLRFIAIGVIAQDPQKFGVAAEPLVF